MNVFRQQPQQGKGHAKESPKCKCLQIGGFLPGWGLHRGKRSGAAFCPRLSPTGTRHLRSVRYCLSMEVPDGTTARRGGVVDLLHIGYQGSRVAVLPGIRMACEKGRPRASRPSLVKTPRRKGRIHSLRRRRRCSRSPDRSGRCYPARSASRNGPRRRRNDSCSHRCRWHRRRNPRYSS